MRYSFGFAALVALLACAAVAQAANDRQVRPGAVLGARAARANPCFSPRFFSGGRPLQPAHPASSPPSLTQSSHPPRAQMLAFSCKNPDPKKVLVKGAVKLLTMNGKGFR
jgi:hypothetical protein